MKRGKRIEISEMTEDQLHAYRNSLERGLDESAATAVIKGRGSESFIHHRTHRFDQRIEDVDAAIICCRRRRPEDEYSERLQERGLTFNDAMRIAAAS